MNSASLLATTLLRRRDFYGKTDKYAPPLNQNSDLELAMQGKGIFDLPGTMTDTLRDQAMNRVYRYQNNWNFYNGWHFISPYNSDGEEKLVLNYCETIVNMCADWMVAKGFAVNGVEGNEQVTELLNRVWEYNDADTILWRTVQFGGICGDAYIYVTVNQRDDLGNELPKEKWTTKLTALNPSWVHPLWNPDNPSEMSSCLIQFPFVDTSGHQKLFSTWITPDKIKVWLNSQQMTEVPNPLGCVNVVHIPHEIVANSNFGRSEIDVLFRLNQRLNTTGGLIDRIVKYHSEPTTIVYGATVSQLEKGANKVWSGLPTDGKVENLELKADLKATVDWYTQLKKEIAVKSEIPFFLLDSSTFTHVSNTSGIAMQLLFQPLISKTMRRRMTYQKGMIRVNKLILLCHEKIIGDDLSKLADVPSAIYNTTIEFTSQLPKDEQQELQDIVLKMQSKIISQAEAIRQVGNVKNVQRLVLELAADARATLAFNRENAIAMQGQQPAFSSVFLASPFLSEDMEEIADVVDSPAIPETADPQTTSDADDSEVD